MEQTCRRLNSAIKQIESVWTSALAAIMDKYLLSSPIQGPRKDAYKRLYMYYLKPHRCGICLNASSSLIQIEEFKLAVCQCIAMHVVTPFEAKEYYGIPYERHAEMPVDMVNQGMDWLLPEPQRPRLAGCSVPTAPCCRCSQAG